MEDILMRFVENMGDRVSGPLHFRFILQPIMATVLATIAGINDAKTGKPPYFWALLTNPEHRSEMLKSGWKSIGKLFVIAMVLDIIFQVIVLRFVYPGEVIVIAILLAVVPYLILRGAVNRVARPFLANK